MTLAADLEVAAQAWVVVLSAALLVFSVVAYARSRNRRILGLTVAFGLFLAKGLLAILNIVQGIPVPGTLLTPALLDTAILISIYLATLRSV
ncbi:MAG: hypothetical protein LN413_07915 [Candidatus Thermoplasmatota archaeon]|nr:hypothetical protein [Candidatus Thermoplasmatota archaeon]